MCDLRWEMSRAFCLQILPQWGHVSFSIVASSAVKMSISSFVSKWRRSCDSMLQRCENTLPQCEQVRFVTSSGSSCRGGEDGMTDVDGPALVACLCCFVLRWRTKALRDE